MGNTVECSLGFNIEEISIEDFSEFYFNLEEMFP